MPANSPHGETIYSPSREPDGPPSANEGYREWSGCFVLAADTCPEAAGPLAAPRDCASAEEYRAAIRWRYRNSPSARQQLAVIARHVLQGLGRSWLPVTGPFAHEAREILESIIRSQPEESAT
jgi:hypothetical protein